MSEYIVGVLIGSLRKESFTRKVAKALMTLAPDDITTEEVGIGDLAMYNQDLDDEGVPHDSWTVFRKDMKRFDAFLFVTPEYNRSVPALMKNAIDVGSRPHDKNIWNGKPAGVVSVSTGALGGFGANHNLRQSLVFVNVPTMQQPEAYISKAASLFDPGGLLINDNTHAFLQKYMAAFSIWIKTILSGRSDL
jgi:chromate reductase, NAD(P)H dehydrogenase (quinone)